VARRALPTAPPPPSPESSALRYTPELILAVGVALSMVFAALLGGSTRTPGPASPPPAVSAPAAAPPTVVIVRG
jgi:hypothetical protein